MSQTDLIIHDEKDNVAVVVIDKTSKNQECIGWIMESDKTIKIKSINETFLGQNSVDRNPVAAFDDQYRRSNPKATACDDDVRTRHSKNYSRPTECV